MKKKMLSLLASIILVTVSNICAAVHVVGVKAQEDFENSWMSGSSLRPEVCSYFVNKMDDYADSERYYYTSMVGARWRYIEGSGEGYGYGVDNVDVFMNCTHGAIGTNPSTGQSVFQFAMWDDNVWVYSDEMRLGDDGEQLSLFSSYDCSEMAGDSGWGGRWSWVFHGGLRYAAAFWGPSYNTSNNDNEGTDFANYLHSETISEAWVDSMDGYSQNEPAVMAAGTTIDQAVSRRDNMSLSNYSTYSRIRDQSLIYARTKWAY